MLTPDMQSKLVREWSFFCFIRVSAWLRTCIVSVPFRFTMGGPIASGLTLVKHCKAIDGPMFHHDPNQVRGDDAGRVWATCYGSCQDELPVNFEFWRERAMTDLKRRKDVLDKRLRYHAWWCLFCEREYPKALARHSSLYKDT